MPQCPVCSTRYGDSIEDCSLCGWNLQPYSLVVGLVPEVFLKEKARLNWAKSLWSRVQPQREQVLKLQTQLQEAAQTAARLQLEVNQVSQEREQLAAAIDQKTAAHTQLKAQFEQTQQTLVRLQKQLQQAAQNIPLAARQSQADRCALPAIALPPVLQSFTFSVVTLDAQGEAVDRSMQTARFFKEDLDTAVLEMIAIPGGEFEMGSLTVEPEREVYESPQHHVTVASFCMSRYPITQEQWRVVANFAQIDRPLDPDPSHFKGDDQPIEQVSWHDAIEFCARLAQATGRGYRLPSEAEWEYACRAGATTPFHFGETILPAFANYDGNYTYAAGAEGQYAHQTVAVGSFEVANAFGLSDMHGNVWEWCADLWHGSYDKAPSDGGVWEQDGIANHRLLRGGAWYCLPSLCRSAQRHWDQADHGGSGISFRVVCSAVE